MLHGHVPATVARLQATGLLPATNHLQLAIGLPLRNPAALDEFLRQLYDPLSPNYRQYLTPEQFAERFGPTEEDYQKVIAFARVNGLTVTATHGNRVLLDVSGPVAKIERAFRVNLRVYRDTRENRTFYSPDTEPSAPADLPMADIQGLSNFGRPQPKLIQSNLANIVPHSGSAPDNSGAYFGNDFRAAYAPETRLNGCGQMVGLLQFDGFYTGDITAYAAAAGNARTNIVVETVLLNGFDGVPVSTGGNMEVSLDIQMAMAMAPGLTKIIVFEGNPNNPIPNDILNAMAASYTVKNLSCSWGWNGGPNTTTENIFLQMAAQGQSFFNASGDSDAFTVGSGSSNGVDNPSVNGSPSSSPNITQVGGTTLAMNGAGISYAGESVWSLGGSSGSSGGVSSFYALPFWQQNITMTANHGSTVNRNIPDVALTAENIQIRYNNGSSATVGGTSVAAPLWAGFMALVNQQAATAGRAAIGFANPSIYALGKGTNYASCFHDTTVGNNFSSVSPTNYPATTGYDLCTGWGTPTGTNLINALVSLADTSIIQNGGFETGNLNGWTLTGNGTIGPSIYNGVVNAGSFTDGSATNFIHSGTYGAFLGDSPQIGTISQTLNTFPGQGYLLSFWLANPTSGSVQQFLVSWNTNSPAVNQIYYLTYPPVLPWTNITFVVTATGTNTTLAFGARNDPQGFGLDDITLMPIPPPSFTGFAKVTNAFVFTWSTLAGVGYQIQYQTNLLNTNWLVLSNLTATASTTSFTNGTSSDWQRFYRIRRLP